MYIDRCVNFEFLWIFDVVKWIFEILLYNLVIWEFFDFDRSCEVIKSV